MSLFSTQRTRRIKHAKKQREYLITNAMVQAHGAGMTYFSRNDGSVLITNQALSANILVDPQVTKAGQLVPMISVITEEPRDTEDEVAVEILEISNMVTTPEMTLGRLIRQYA